MTYNCSLPFMIIISEGRNRPEKETTMKNKKDLFTIPNIIGYVRILLIPVFCWLYIRAETAGDYFWATMVVLFSSFTDLFDGLIARKFNQVTELGKVLDPVADKLTHCAMAVCLVTRYPLMWALLGLMAVKESYMAYMGIKYIKKDRMMDGAQWYGKVCTACLFAGMVVLFFFYNMQILWANLLIGSLMLLMLVTLLLYVRFYRNLEKNQ